MTATERPLGVHVPFVSNPRMQEACGLGPQGRGERGARVHRAPVLGLLHTENPPGGHLPTVRPQCPAPHPRQAPAPSGNLHALIPANISANRGSLSWEKMASAFSTDFPAS